MFGAPTELPEVAPEDDITEIHFATTYEESCIRNANPPGAQD